MSNPIEIRHTFRQGNAVADALETLIRVKEQWDLILHHHPTEEAMEAYKRDQQGLTLQQKITADHG